MIYLFLNERVAKLQSLPDVLHYEQSRCEDESAIRQSHICCLVAARSLGVCHFALINELVFQHQLYHFWRLCVFTLAVFNIITEELSFHQNNGERVTFKMFFYKMALPIHIKLHETLKSYFVLIKIFYFKIYLYMNPYFNQLTCIMPIKFSFV